MLVMHVMLKKVMLEDGYMYRMGSHYMGVQQILARCDS